MRLLLETVLMLMICLSVLYIEVIIYFIIIFVEKMS